MIDQLTGGLAGMAKGRKDQSGSTVWVNIAGANALEVEGENGKTVINNFDDAMIAAGSSPDLGYLPFIPHEDPRIWDSTKTRWN